MSNWEKILKEVVRKVDEVKFTGTLEEFLVSQELSFNKLCTKILNISRGAGQRVLRGESSPTFARAFFFTFPNVTLTDIAFENMVNEYSRVEGMREETLPENLEHLQDIKNLNVLRGLDMLLSECDIMRDRLNLLTAGIAQIKYTIMTGNNLIEEFEELPEEIEEVDGDLI